MRTPLPVVLLLLSAASAFAQPASGGVIMGQVLDSIGVPRPAMTVTLTSADGRVRSAVSDREGVYIFRNLPLCEYKLEAASGTYDAISLTLSTGQPQAMRDLGPRKAPYDRKKKSAKKLPASPPPPPQPTVAATGAKNLALKTVYFATDRATNGSVMSAAYFTGERHSLGKVNYGTCDVNIPLDHKFGQLETPNIFELQFVPDPKQHFFVKTVDVIEKDPFFLQLKAAVQKSPQRQAFVFVHGYNVSFESAALRTAQMAVDLKFEGAPVFYSWPSRGRLAGYLDDERTVQLTVANLKEFLQDVSARSGAQKVHLVAHSMGSRALTQALKELGGQPVAPPVKFHELILAAPDLDADTFRQMESAIHSTAEKVTLYASSGDKALIASDIVHGLRRRLGQAGSNLFVDTRLLDTIDATAVETDFLDHSYFADSASILADFKGLVIDGRPPAQRPHLAARQAPGGTYWVYVPH